MAREAPATRLLRETLERVLMPATASAVIFEALQVQGCGPPSDAEECLELVRGALRQVLSNRIGDTEAASVLDQLEMILQSIAGQPRQARKSSSRHDMKTAAVELDEMSKRSVYVLSGSRDFVARLKAATGPLSVTTIYVPDESALIVTLSTTRPVLVLIDADDVAGVSAENLVGHLRPLASHVVKALYGTESDFAARVRAEGERHGVEITPFDRTEGIEPLMDIIRSRCSG